MEKKIKLYNNIEPENNPDKLYLLASFARSFDKYHVENSLIHLVMCKFYTTSNNFNQKIENLKKVDTFKLIIRIYNGDVSNYSLTKGLYDEKINCYLFHHSENLVEICIDIKQLVYYQDVKKQIKMSTEFMEKLLNLIAGSVELEEKDSYYILNNILFIFEDVNYFTVEVLAKFFNIRISGGSISKRSCLSTVQYNMSYFLMHLGYSFNDVYESKLINKKRFEKINYNENINNLQFDKNIVSSYIKYILDYKINNLNFQISTLENDIKNMQDVILNLDKSLEGEFELLLISDNQLRINRNTILEKENKIALTHNNISKLKEEVSELSDKLNFVDNAKLDELKKYYFDYFDHEKIRDDFEIVNKTVKIARSIIKSKKILANKSKKNKKF